MPISLRPMVTISPSVNVSSIVVGLTRAVLKVKGASVSFTFLVTLKSLATSARRRTA